MPRMTHAAMAERIYARFYGHLDDGPFQHRKLVEIAGWLHDGDPMTLAQVLHEWADYDIEEIERQAEKRPAPRAAGKLLLSVDAETRAILLVMAREFGCWDAHRPGVPSISELVRRMASGRIKVG